MNTARILKRFEFLDQLAQIGGWDDFDRMFRNAEHIDDEVKIYFNMCCVLKGFAKPFTTIKKVDYNKLNQLQNG